MYEILKNYIEEITGAPLPDGEFNLLQGTVTPKKIRRRQYFLQEGEVCRYMGFITKGAMRQYSVDAKGVEHIIRFGIEHWWMGDRESFIMLTPTRYNVDAVEDSDLLLISNAQLQDLIVRSPSIAKMTRVLDERSQIASQKRIHASISYTAEERFVELRKTNPAFLQRFPQNMIASYLGITPETLSRVRKNV